jgi:hypothetical protein
MKRLLLLVDSRSYIRSNCYQHQLAATLARHFDVRMLSVREIKTIPLVRLANYDVILSVMRLRTVSALLDRLARFLRDRPVFIYEQDIWHAFMDDSPYRGAYHRIAGKLNVRAFLATSNWWRDYAASQNLPVRFVRMGMLPEYCVSGPEWNARSIRLGFQGSLHPHRKAFFQRLADMRLPVQTLPSAPYRTYLDNLHSMRIYIHNEDDCWLVDGKRIARNALWIKETEVASRGTFVIRDYEEEAEAYGISELPTVMPFRSIEEVPEIVHRIEAMDPSERRDRMVASAETMRRRDDWATVVHALEA